jgi:hypothetical protein
LLLVAALALIVLGVNVVNAWTPVAVVDDLLVRMPGTQPEQGVALESPNRCLNCHAGYNSAVEPGFNWQGSMMAQSARDPIFWAAMTVAAQDSLWAVGTPNAADICERCHFPKGWLEGRSDPTNASAMTGADYDGVQCDFCHRMFDPFFENTHAGVVAMDWDETNASGTHSQPAADATYQEDLLQAQALTFFNGAPFYGATNLPDSAGYTEATSGQYYVSNSADKRASFADADARHQMLYSRFHKSQTFCATCHDVSNPVLANLGADPAQLLPTELQSAYSYNHAERTYSEFYLSAYRFGAAGLGPFAPDVFETSNPGNVVNKCQDCHMRDVVGAGADKRGVPVRPGDSVEHPQSGQPLHDLTGGNVWVSAVLASAIPGSPNYDATNDALLNQGPAVLTLDLSQGQGIDPVALLAGSDRAAQQLQLAAAIQNISYDAASGDLQFRVQNQTGHKLISGFPEGRRMWVNVKVYSGGSLIYEVNPYDAAAGTLKGLSYPYLGQGLPDPQLPADHEVYVDALVYEVHPSSTLTVEDKTFHFALADDRYKDNRIPPMGFDVVGSVARLAQPRWDGADALDLFSVDEYDGGYDDVTVSTVSGGDYVEVSLYYQTTSREYIEFLRDEINGAGNLTLTSPTPSGLAEAYVIQTDPFFAGLAAWGDTIWQLWLNNMNLPGAAPFLMTQNAVGGGGGGGGGCTPPAAPELLAAVPDHTQVTLAWSDVGATGYNVYYDQADKTQFVADAGAATTYVDSGLTNGQQYCYVVTAYDSDASCESTVSNTLCATPSNQVANVTVSALYTGRYEGNGGNATFVPASTFTAGEKVIIRLVLEDAHTGAPIAGGVVDLVIGGPATDAVTTSPSDATGLAEGAWGTKRNSATGSYIVTVSNVTAAGYVWDGDPVSVTLELLAP